jgi:uncharacterized DUF497 family protein
LTDLSGNFYIIARTEAGQDKTLLEFEWDNKKNQSNIKKHSVSFNEAVTVFKDPCSLCYFDPDHSDEEFRFILIGVSENNNILVVSYTERDDNIRVISARKATKHERLCYEQEQ